MESFNGSFGSQLKSRWEHIKDTDNSELISMRPLSFEICLIEDIFKDPLWGYWICGNFLASLPGLRFHQTFLHIVRCNMLYTTHIQFRIKWTVNSIRQISLYTVRTRDSDKDYSIHLLHPQMSEQQVQRDNPIIVWYSTTVYTLSLLKFYWITSITWIVYHYYYQSSRPVRVPSWYLKRSSA